MDVGSGIALLGPAAIVAKILGPTADYLGTSMAEWTKVRIENLRRVFANAQEKLGAAIESPGEVPPKVLKALLDGASFDPDPLAVEYFGGVLASARTTVKRDDRGAAFVALVESLSAYQIRSHYLTYATIAKLFAGTRRTPQVRTGDLVLYIPFDAYCSAMDFSPEESRRASVLMIHSFYGLQGRKLISDRFTTGSVEHLRQAIEGDCRIHKFDFPSEGLVIEPTVLGFQLFASAHGLGDTAPDDLFAPGVPFRNFASVPPIPEARRLTDFQRTVPGNAAKHSHFGSEDE